MAVGKQEVFSVRVDSRTPFAKSDDTRFPEPANLFNPSVVPLCRFRLNESYEPCAQCSILAKKAGIVIASNRYGRSMFLRLVGLFCENGPR